MIIMAIGLIAAGLQLRTPQDSAFPDVVRQFSPVLAWHGTASSLSPGIFHPLAHAAAVLTIVLIALSLRRRGGALAFLLLTLLLMNLLFVFVRFGGHRHSGLILLCLLVAIWMAREIPETALSRAAAILLNIALAVSSAFAISMARADIRLNFSGSREMGQFLQTRDLDRYQIAAHNMHQGEAVLAWLPARKFWYPAVGRYGSYMLWNREENEGIYIPYEVAIDRARAHFQPRGEPWLLMLNRPIPSSVRGFRLLYATQGPVFRHRDERYWLYQPAGQSTR